MVLFPLVLPNGVMVQLESLCYNFSNKSFPLSCDCVKLKPNFFHTHKEISSFLTVIFVIIIISLNFILTLIRIHQMVFNLPSGTHLSWTTYQ